VYNRKGGMKMNKNELINEIRKHEGEFIYTPVYVYRIQNGKLLFNYDKDIKLLENFSVEQLQELLNDIEH
jgi:hypothetical protein